jgi:DNA-binding GntR family transcriptional regulator
MQAAKIAGGKARQKASARPGKGRGRDHVYESLKRRIVTLGLAPGEEIEEAAVVEELGVSRTPVREALVKLAGDGLVLLMPNRGARVMPMDLAHVQEHLEAFDLMQRVATRWAAIRRADKDAERIGKLAAEFEEQQQRNDPLGMTDANFRFHEAIGLACGNATVAKFYTHLLSEGLRVARLAMAYECYGSAQAFNEHISKILTEHRLIVEAIRLRDADTAERLAASHSGLARKRVLEYLSVNLADGLSLKAAAE